MAAGEIVAVAVQAGDGFAFGDLGPLDFAPLILDASICLSVRISYSGSRVAWGFSVGACKLLIIRVGWGCERGFWGV